MIRSECVKYKNTMLPIVFVASTIFLLIFGYLVFHWNSVYTLSERNSIFIAIVMIIKLIELNFITTYMYDMEIHANHLQNILGYKRSGCLWSTKILVLCFLELMSTGVVLGINKILVEVSINSYVSLFCGMFFFFTSMIFMDFILLMQWGVISNIVNTIIQGILLIFATNIPMRKVWKWFPGCYGYKIIEFYNELDRIDFIIPLSISVVLLIFNIYMINRKN